MFINLNKDQFQLEIRNNRYYFLLTRVYQQRIQYTLQWCQKRDSETT